MIFDTKTSEQLKYYVYALIDPENNKPFYIGKGLGNRVFSHLNCSLENELEADKYEKIREIEQINGQKVIHLILRHGMTEEVAFIVESTLIDLLNFLGNVLTNLQIGHYSGLFGLMTSDDVVRKYNALPLIELSDPVIIININKTYKEQKFDKNGIYEATRSSWVIGKSRRDKVRYALSEYRGLIVEVFEIERWYEVPRPEKKNKNGESQIRWAFEGKVANKNVREKYLNKSVAHLKKQGAANPIRYTVDPTPLDKLFDPVMLININKSYEKRSTEGIEGIYEATRSSWVISEHRRNNVRYALSEYRGLIVEVFEIEEWYEVPRPEKKNKNGELQIRWAFNGKVADKSIRDKYIYKSVRHLKEKGQANPIRFLSEE